MIVCVCVALLRMWGVEIPNWTLLRFRIGSIFEGEKIFLKEEFRHFILFKGGSPKFFDAIREKEEENDFCCISFFSINNSNRHVHCLAKQKSRKKNFLDRKKCTTVISTKNKVISIFFSCTRKGKINDALSRSASSKHFHTMTWLDIFLSFLFELIGVGVAFIKAGQSRSILRRHIKVR